MTLVLPTLVLLAWSSSAPLGGQEAKPPLAKVTVNGKEAAVVVTDDKKDRYIVIELSSKTTVKVHTEQDLAAIHKQVLDEHEKLTKDFEATLQKLIERKDFKAIKAAEAAMIKAGEKVLENLGYCAADGTLTQVDGQLHMDGKLRVYAAEGADKDIAKGKALVEGQATHVKGKDDKTTLSIHNGPHPILVTGKVAEEHAKANGTIRVIGVLRSGGKGASPVIEAEKIEVLKK